MNKDIKMRFHKEYSGSKTDQTCEEIKKVISKGRYIEWTNLDDSKIKKSCFYFRNKMVWCIEENGYNIFRFENNHKKKPRNERKCINKNITFNNHKQKKVVKKYIKRRNKRNHIKRICCSKLQSRSKKWFYKI